MSKISPEIASRLDEGFTKHKAGDLKGALILYEKVLKKHPAQPDALWLKGTIFLQSGDPHLAIPLIEKAIKARPDDAAIWNDLGMALEATGDQAGSRKVFEKAVALDPTQASAQINLARFLVGDRDFDAALDAIDKAIGAQAYLPEAHNVRGSVLRDLGRLDESLAAYATGLSHDPHNAEILVNKGLLLHQQNDLLGTRTALERALKVAPEGTAPWADATMTLGVISAEAGNLEDALDIYDQVIGVCPDHVITRINRGGVRERTGQLDGADSDYRAALAIDPGCKDAQYNLSRLQLLRGQWSDGWDGYETRWGVSSFVSKKRDRGLPLWDGNDLPGQELLIWGEQGVGDQILFSGILSNLSDLDLEVVVEIEPRLVPLIQRASQTLSVYGYDSLPEEVIKSCRAQIPIGSLGRLFRRSLADFASPQSHIKADERSVADLANKYKAHAEGRLMVGIAWHSVNPSFGTAKSLSLEQWSPILKSENAFFVSLQYGDTGAAIADAENNTGVRIFSDPDVDPMQSLDAAASQIAALDLVIATSGTAVHLAGALGKEAWVMVPKFPEWRWGLSGDAALWYPNVQIFRQTEKDQWSEVLDTVAKALSQKT